MQANHMLKFMAQHKPEVVDAIKTQRHADYWFFIGQPEAHAINFCTRQRFDNHVSDSAFSEYPRHLPYRGRRNQKFFKLRNHSVNRASRVTSSEHFACDFLHSIQPSNLRVRSRSENISFLCRVGKY